MRTPTNKPGYPLYEMRKFQKEIMTLNDKDIIIIRAALRVYISNSREAIKIHKDEKVTQQMEKFIKEAKAAYEKL